MAIDIDNYPAIVDSIAETIAKVTKPLTANQRIVLTGALAVWMERARDVGREATEGNKG